MTNLTKQQDTFGYVGRGKKLHFTLNDYGTLVSSCWNAAGDWIGKPITRIGKTVEYEGTGEIGDQNLAVDALKEIRAWVTDEDICKHCWKARFF